MAFGLPAKNQFEIDKAINGKEQPPEPVYYLNRDKAVREKVDSLGFDVKEMTEQASSSGTAEGLFKSVFGKKAPTLTPEDTPKPSEVANESLNLPPRAVPSEQDANVPPPEGQPPVAQAA